MRRIVQPTVSEPSPCSADTRAVIGGCIVCLALLSVPVVVAVAGLMRFEPADSIAEVLAPEWNREFGLLEVVQSLLLLGMAAILLLTPRLARRVAGVVVALILLEESDYFLHLWDWVAHGDVWRTNLAGHRNLHNQTWVDLLRDFGYSAATGALLLLSAYRFIRPATADTPLPMRRCVAAVVLGMVLVFVVSHFLWVRPPDSGRQILNETHELVLYAAAALVASEMDRASPAGA